MTSPARAVAHLPGAATGALGLLRGGSPSSGRVRQVAPPPDARRLSTLPRLDYADAFLVDPSADRRRTAEQWARAMLEGASADTRRALRLGWSTLGFQLGPADDDELVLGWEVRRDSPDHVLLGVDSPLGLRGEVLFQRRGPSLLFATFVKHDNPLMRTLWIGVAPGHRQAVRSLLAQVTGR